MADADEDTFQTSEAAAVENDLSEETQDFRFLNSLSLKDPSSSKLPKRGEKDFEPHATNLQADILAASRDAMHTAISFPRTHHPKTHLIALYDIDSGESYIDNATGTFHRTMGVVKKGSPKDENRLWLLPEETLYLIERGSLDVRWPADMGNANECKTGQTLNESEEDHDDSETEGQGIPMSLQGAYTACLGMGPSPPTLEQYLVFSGLKRAGYIVFRAETWGAAQPKVSVDSGDSILHGPRSTWGLDFFRELWKRFSISASQTSTTQTAFGPLVKPGLYRNYAQIYQKLQLIPFHNPSTEISSDAQSSPIQPDPAFHISYYVWKPSPKFKKSNPGPPDFRIAVVSARETSLPTLAQLSGLIGSMPDDPAQHEAQMYQKLRHGYRNVLIAVVDQGVVSYMRFADAGFGCERLYERKSKAGPGGKKGGGAGGSRKGRHR